MSKIEKNLKVLIKSEERITQQGLHRVEKLVKAVEVLQQNLFRQVGT